MAFLFGLGLFLSLGLIQEGVGMQEAEYHLNWFIPWLSVLNGLLKPVQVGLKAQERRVV